MFKTEKFVAQSMVGVKPELSKAKQVGPRRRLECLGKKNCFGSVLGSRMK